MQLQIYKSSLLRKGRGMKSPRLISMVKYGFLQMMSLRLRIFKILEMLF